MSKFKSILIAFMCVIACFAFASCNWDVPSDGSTGDKTSISETTSDKESDSVKESTSEKVSTCEHEFVLQSEEAPDCTHAGKKTFKCGKCGETKTEEGEAALGHLFGEWEVVNAETCTVDGEEVRYCTREKCDGMETRAIPAAHKYAENTAESVAPTCEKVGKDVYECSVCHDKYDEVVPALGHEENTDIERIVVEATCEKGGYTTLTCARCGKTYNIDETEALGHNYETGESVEATCDFAGYTAMKCSRCDKNYRKITAAKLSHTIGDDGVCKTCGKTYLEANALIVSSEDNQAYAVKDDVYDYLVYAKDDTSYQTTITIDRQIVDKLIANRYFKINFMFGNPDNCYRAMGYKLPGDENFRYVNVFQTEGLGDNTLFTLVIADENGADETIVTEAGITLTLLYRYNGKDGVTSDKEPEEKYHGTLNNFALKIEYVQIAKPFDYEDKTTWLATDYKVTYTDNLSWKMNGAMYRDEKNVTIKAETIAALIAHGYESLMFALSFEPGEKVIYYVDDKTQGNIVNYVSATIPLTEEAAKNGLTYKILYNDVNHVDPAWGGTKDVDGFTFTLTLIKKFSLDDKETWVKSAYAIVYNETENRFEVTDGDPGKEQIEKDVIITAELLSAMKAQKYGSFIITMKCKPNQLPILGMKTSAWAYGAPGADLAGSETVISGDMLANGYTFRGLYADKAQRDKITDYDKVNGFYFTIEFIKEFNPETDEVISTATDCVYAEGIYTLTGKDPRVTVLAKAIAYWLDNGYTSIDIIVSDKEGQRAGKNVQINGTDHGTNNQTTTVNVTLTEEMRASGLSIILYWSDISGWAGGSAPDGVTLQIVAKK